MPVPRRPVVVPPPEDDLRAALAAVAGIDVVPRILATVCQLTGMGFAAVARVTDEKWVACAVLDKIGFGLTPGGELDLRSTLCHEIRGHHRPIVIDHVATDPEFCAHHTPRKYGFQSYISVPIHLEDGSMFGTLCAIDPKPASLKTSGMTEVFTLFASLIANHLDMHLRVQKSEARVTESGERLQLTEKELLEARQSSQLRELFIAVLGHDLRNPLAAIASAVGVLNLLPGGEDQRELQAIIHNSVARMNSLIDNVLDFAKGRLGGGLSLSRTDDDRLDTTLRQVVAELQSAWPHRAIELHLDLTLPVSRDDTRIAQLLSNLLGNALAYGDPVNPVVVRASTQAQDWSIEVTNRGPTIPPEKLATIFEPFVRGQSRENRTGLGLGLHIAFQIARAHGGALVAESLDGLTTFTFRAPRLPTRNSDHTPR